ncbi:MAG: LysE family translocator [Opitutales bacterium]|nr:LysE family translocator [Opitutales bacterium]
MSLDLLLTFGAAAFAVVLIPGPTVMLVTGYAMSRGRSTALLSIFGVCLGDMTAMILTFLGLGTILAASSTLFIVLKWVGVVYLMILGIQLWRAPVDSEKVSRKTERSSRKIVFQAFTVNVLHPKGLAFYAAFLPQFIDPSSPALRQMLILAAVFMTVAASVLLGYAFVASRFRSLFARPRARRTFNRSGALCLFAAGTYTAFLRHNPQS